MKIVIDTIPHDQQRYETVGDWTWDGATLNLLVSDMGDWRKEMCVAFHEMFEAVACKHAGITQEAVDEFDKAWKEHDGIEEPGDDPEAPYHVAHVTAGIAERLLALNLGLNWDEYNKTVQEL